MRQLSVVGLSLLLLASAATANDNGVILSVDGNLIANPEYALSDYRVAVLTDKGRAIAQRYHEFCQSLCC